MGTLLIQLPKPRFQQYILVILVFLAFSRSMTNGYSLDDSTVTTYDQELVSKGFDGIPEILKSPYSKAGYDGADSFDYRPVPLITFAVEKAIFGFTPGVSHFINLLLYIFLILLVFQILRNILKDYPEWIPFVVTAIFAIHPLHSEVVVSLKNRDELLVAIFGFGALLATMKFFTLRKWYYIVLIFLCVMLGGNSKLTYGPFLYFIPITLYFFRWINIRQAAVVLVGLFAVGYLAFYGPRLFIEEGLSRQIDYFENPLLFMPFAARIPMAFYSFLIYCKLHFFPFPLLSYYGFNHVEVLGWTDFQVYLGFLIVVILIFLLIKSWHKNPLLAFGIMTFVIFMSPYQNFPVVSTGIIAERFAFNSVLGIGLIFIAIVLNNPLTGERWKDSLKYRRYLKITLLAILIVFTFINISRTGDWKDEITLVRADVKKAPNSVKLQMLNGEYAQKNIALAQNQQQKNALISEATSAYQMVISIYPKHAATYNNLGVINSLTGNYAKAIPMITKAIELGDDKAENYFNLGACYEISGNINKAKENYRVALRKDNSYKPALERLKILESK